MSELKYNNRISSIACQKDKKCQIIEITPGKKVKSLSPETADIIRSYGREVQSYGQVDGQKSISRTEH